MALTASEFVALKAKVKAEMARRNQYGSLANYAGTAYDFPISPTTGGAILANQGDKVIDLMLAVTDISGLASVHKGDLLPHLVDSTPIDGTNLLSKDAASITNWTVRIPSATTVTKGVGDYDATLSYTTIGGWEIVVSPPIAVEPNTAYTASLEYSVDTAFTSSGGDLYFGLQVCSHAPNGSASSSSGTVYAHLNFPNAVTALSRRSVTFTPTGPIVYLVFNGGNINDGQTVTFQINKLKLEKGTTHTGWSEPPASENQSINLNTIVDMWASQPMISNVSLPSCRGACTGLCTSGCSGTCTGCGGCSGSCQGCSACGNACDGGCYGCAGGCSSCAGCTGCAGSSCKGCSGCGSSGCKRGCGSGCTSGCKSGCGGCGGGCAGGCGGGCDGLCGNSCSSGCYTGCTGCNGCNGCSGGCQNSCQSTCSTTCSNTCSNQCYGYCTGSSTNVIYGAQLSTE